MSITSLQYVAFVAVVAILYFMQCNPRWQRGVLLLADFYLIVAVDSKKTLLLILILCLFVYGVGRGIEHYLQSGRKSRAHLLLYMGILGDIGLLLYFKFFKDTWTLIQIIWRRHMGFVLWDLMVPVGIAYYSLALMGYLIDIYHKRIKAERNIWDFLNFVLYFPAIFQGPINLYKKLSPQLKEAHAFDEARVVDGLQRILWGYVKKVVIADRIGVIVASLYGDPETAGILMFYTYALYSFQIYADFSGGIDVIMGVSRMLDIELTENFKSPFVATSVTDFWKRWHASLGEWMEKYIYFPIVLNRRVQKFSKKISNKYMRKVFAATLASVIVFVIVGIWHGTGWNYVVYGLYQAFWVSMAVLLAPVYKKMKAVCHVNDKCLSWRIFVSLRTFMILVIGRYFSRAENLEVALWHLGKTFTSNTLYTLFDGTLLEHGLDYSNMVVMYIGILLILLVEVLNERGIILREKLMTQDIVFRYVVYLVGLFAIIIFGMYGAEFNSASFIYQGF